jgi:hypothetical protein
MSMDFTPLKWQAHEYDHFERTSDWYWAVGIITLSIITLAILFNDFLFAVVIIIGVFCLMLYVHRKPKVVEYEINKKGIRSNKTLYIYGSIESFWVDSHIEHHAPKLILKSAKVIMPYIVIPIEGISPELIHTYLIEFLPEEEHHEPIPHRVMEYLGF